LQIVKLTVPKMKQRGPGDCHGIANYLGWLVPYSILSHFWV